MERTRKKTSPALVLLVVAVSVIALRLVACHPDRPLPRLEPGSSAEPTFFVQLVRPRVALPLGGLVPPEWLDADERLGFDARTPGARGSAEADRVELRAPGWRVLLSRGPDGALTADSEVAFELRFQGERRAALCRPAPIPPERWELTPLSPGGEVGGEFGGTIELELGPCVDAVSGEPLGWPSAPLRLRVSFDRLSAPDAAFTEVH